MPPTTQGPLLERIAFFLFTLLVAGLAFVVLPQAFESYIRPKETVLWIGLTAVLALGVVGALLQGSLFRIPLLPVNAAAGLLVLWALASALWAEAPRLAVEEAGRWLGFVVLFLLAQSFLMGSRPRLRVLMLAFGGSTVLVALFVVAQDFRQAFLPGTIHVRAVLGDWRDALSRVAFGNTSHIADYLAIGFLFWIAAFLLARGRWRRTGAMAALWLHAAALIVCWSVHSNLSIIIAAGLLLWLLRDLFTDRELRFPVRPFAILAVGWLGLVAFYTVDHPVNPHGSAVWAERMQSPQGMTPGEARGGIFAEAFSSPRWHAGWETRLAIWFTTLEIVRENPWFGTGAGNFTYVYPATRTLMVTENPQLAPYGGMWTNAAHNDLLQQWAELGIVGLMLLVLLAALSIKEYAERLRGRLPPVNRVILGTGLAALAAQLIQMQMNFPLELPVSTMLFFLLLALPFVLPKAPPEQEDMLMPVERSFGPVRLGIMMRNMAAPSELHLGWHGEAAPRAATAGLVAVALAGGLLVSERLLRPVRADMAFRTAREAKVLADAGHYPGGVEATLPLFRKSLAIWPHHGDAQSTYQDALFRAGRHEETILQTPRVLEKLNATEVYQRRAMALLELGRLEESLDDWEVIYNRRPDFLRGQTRILQALEARRAAED